MLLNNSYFYINRRQQIIFKLNYSETVCAWFRNMESSQMCFLLLLFLLLCASSIESKYLKYQDPKQPLNIRINDLMKRMTLAEKIGQMTQIEREVASTKVMKDYFIGSVLSGPGSVPRSQATPKDWIYMINKFQKGSLSACLGVSMIYGIDAAHGSSNIYKATIFPHNIGLGATRDPELVKKIGAATALEARATGIPYVFAPCIAVCRDPRWGLCYESYSEDHRIVQAMTEIIPGLQGEIPANYSKGIPYVAGRGKDGHYIVVAAAVVSSTRPSLDKVAACAKHYVGEGGTFEGIDRKNTITDRHELLSIHMPAYYNSIAKGVSTVMVSYSSWNGVKMHANRGLITGFLKNTLRFRVCCTMQRAWSKKFWVLMGSPIHWVLITRIQSKLQSTLVLTW